MEWYSALIVLVGSLMGILTSYTDIKTGFIFDNHVFPTLAFVEKAKGLENEGEEVIAGRVEKIIIPATEIGFIVYLYLGLVKGDYLLAISGILGFFIGLVLGLILYYAGAWASGDVLVLAAFSALLPYPLSFARVVAPYEASYPLYPIAILFNGVLAVFPFLFVYALGVLLVRKNIKRLKDVFSERAYLSVEVALWLLAGIGLALFLNRLGLSVGGAYQYVLTIVLFVVFGKYRKAGDVAGLVSLTYLVYLTGTDALYAFAKLLAVVYSFKVFFSVVRVLREEALVEEVPVEELREWDILGETIYIEGDVVKRDRRGFFEVLRDALRTGDIKFQNIYGGEVIASPTAEGLKREQLEKLKELVREGKLDNRFLRKKAMPFAPSIFLGFLIAALWGDVFWWLVLKMAGL
ncbi:A24 family peptidase C-terminal domain-containing protein [Thermococcus waiotapuensis]|uniref:A24 family peptidase C-terminal domain-containing protein n=1 Tax=Thermococcus waiotapuensis TaxID=90909 RepID=A0AAE4NX22_9EURY|nr:A24 family peptidase C-terminal domain-containing protein [Thermococcus waiotapuensis]MDV3104418.1 A24 family peptidase C-terminal domain-containing protein [Thermococcus waiotapuensis]